MAGTFSWLLFFGKLHGFYRFLSTKKQDFITSGLCALLGGHEWSASECRR